jgi:acyl-CoA thioesterase I
MKKNKIIYLSLAFLLFVSCSPKEIKVACVGDRITEGSGLACQSKTAYPVVLDSILGPGYSVLNFGRGGAAMIKKSGKPYWNCKEFYDVFAFNPNIIIIKLGTNDVDIIIDDSSINNVKAEIFSKDYQAMIDTFNTLSNKPEIFVCLPVPIYANNCNMCDSTLRISIIPAIRRIAEVNNLPVIDLYTQMSNQPENFSDGVHPTEKGARIMAEFVASEITKPTMEH